MATEATLNKVKQSIRRSHNKLDEDLMGDIDACLADLKTCGVLKTDETDPLIFNAIKLWCRSLNTDDTIKAAEWLRRYDALKACLMMAEGYGYPAEVSDDG